MATLALRRSAWQNATEFQRRVLRLIGDTLRLGDPAVWKNPSNVEWFIFDDERFSLTHTAYLGALLNRLADLTPAQEAALSGKSDAEIRAIVKNNLAGTVVLPNAITYTTSNVWQETLDANSAPNVVKMASGIPAGWTVVG